MSFIFKNSSKTDGGFTSICSNSDGSQLIACTEHLSIDHRVNVSGTYGSIWVSYDYGFSFVLKSWIARTIKGVCSNSSGSQIAIVSTYGGVNKNYGIGIYGWDFGNLNQTALNYSSICCNSSGSLLAACVNNGFIYISTNNGKLWSQKETSRVWSSICCNSSGSIIAACVDYGNIYISTDNGNNWRPEALFKNWKSVCCNSSGSKIFGACSNDFDIHFSINSGFTWRTVSGSTRRNFMYVCCDSSGSKYATFTDTNEIYVNTGSGLLLSSLPSGTSNLTSICMTPSGDRILATMNKTNGNGGIIYGYIPKNFYYNNLYIENIIANISLNDASYKFALNDANYNMITNYTTNGSSINFLKPFYIGTNNEAIFNNDIRFYVSTPYIYNGTQKLCPPYYFYGGKQNWQDGWAEGLDIKYAGIPPSGATEMLVILVGSGGGGGGGSSKAGGGSAGGGGGGGGQINVFHFNVVASMTYSIFISKGGKYGYSFQNATAGPGGIDTSSPNSSGYPGSVGTYTSFTYNNVTRYASSGFPGSGAASGTTGGAGGAGGNDTGTVAKPAGLTAWSSGSIYSYNGNSGSVGGGANDTTTKPGGVGGTPSYENIINPNVVNLTYWVPESFYPGTLLNTRQFENNTSYILYGQGGSGGRGDSAGDWGANGEFGAPGCVIIFFKY